jgi:2,4-dienoyl-CoA reductase-like NADH-dependent reductase (Old Yellow Enzyme family)
LDGAVQLRGRTAASRVLFGPHETNLAFRREISDRHVAYYARRAAGGAGVIVTEVASVHDSDWPYERAPRAADAVDGWAAVVAACRPHGALVLAGLGHAGAQGSSGYGRQALWGASPVADPVSREVPVALEQPEIDALVAGFGASAALAAEADLDGVEVNAGQHSILRQFLSGLTNHRADGYGGDRARLLREVLAAVRAGLGGDRVLGLRLCADELAPWAGITPEDAVATATALPVDYLVPVRGSGLSVWATRPDLHEEPGFNRELCARVRAAVEVPVILQGSVVDPAFAQAALDEGVADLVEMTRAQIADPDLVAHVRAGTPDRIRPSTLSNQRTSARDPRNPLISDDAEPGAGHETQEPPLDERHIGTALSDESAVRTVGEAGRGGHRGRSASDERHVRTALWDEGAVRTGRGVLVVGGGPAGLEAARVLASLGVPVRLLERAPVLGGALRFAAAVHGRARMGVLIPWYERELARLGVRVETGVEVGAADLDGSRVLLATGSRPGPRGYPCDVPVLDAAAFEAAVLEAAALPAGPVVVHDPLGDWTGVGIAEQVAATGRPVALVTPDQVVGHQLAATGDLVPANARLARAGVARERRARLRRVERGRALLEDVWTGAAREIDCALVLDCGHRLPDDALWAARPHLPRAGDCVAPRTVHEAVREGRAAALALS